MARSLRADPPSRSRPTRPVSVFSPMVNCFVSFWSEPSSISSYLRSFDFVGAHLCVRPGRTPRSAPKPCKSLKRNISVFLVKFTRFAFGPLEKPIGVDDNLSFGIDLDVRAIHRARRRPFKVNAFAVVTTAVTRTLKLVLARLPVRGTTQMRAARINHKQTIRRLVHPDAILLLPFRIHPQR